MNKRDTKAFRERFNRWKAGEQVYDKGRPIELPEYQDGKEGVHRRLGVTAGSKVNTEQCAAWSNQWLRDNGYLASGNAWNLNDMDVVYNGFENLQKLKHFDRQAIEKMNHQASDSVYANFKSRDLYKTRPYAVNMFYNGSPALESAYNEGDGVTGTHTGVLTFDDKSNRWWVTHNIHGTIHQEPFVTLQSGNGKYGVTAVYMPRKNTILNKIKGMIGLTSGKDSGVAIKPIRKTVYRAFGGDVFSTREDAIKHNKKYLSDIENRMIYKSRTLPTYKQYEIPFIQDKAVTLTNAGYATGANLSTNLLDTLAEHAVKNEVPVKTAIGLGTKESTLGNPTDDGTFHTLFADKTLRDEFKRMYNEYGTEQHINLGYAVSPKELINMHFSPDPYLDALEWAYKKGETKKQVRQMLKNGEAYADRQAKKLIESGEFNKNILDAGFQKFKEDPKGYNPGQKNYVELVDRRANEIWNSPEIQQWYKQSKYYGFKYGKDSINIKPSKRGTFTAAAKRRGMSVSQLESVVLNNPSNYSEAMRKKAQFSRNARKWRK